MDFDHERLATNSMALTRSTGSVMAEAGDAARGLPSRVASPNRPKQSLFQFIGGALRGRYTLVIILGLITGGVGGLIAWRKGRVLYQSDALVQISAIVQTAEGDQKFLANYTMFMGSQRTLISSKRTIDLAIQDPVWRATGRAVPEHPEQYFASNLSVDVSPGSEFIRISVTDTDPAMAGAAATAILNAYTQSYKETEERWGQTQRGILETTRAEAQVKIAGLEKALGEASTEYGTSNLDVYYSAAATRLTKLEAEMFDIRVALAPTTRQAAAQASLKPAAALARGAATPAAPRPDPMKMSEEEIAELDPSVRQFLVQQELMSVQIEKMKERGLTDEHTDVKAVKQDIARIRAKLDRQVSLFRRVQAAIVHQPQDNSVEPIVGGPSPIDRKVMALNSDKASLEELYKEAKAEVADLGRRSRDLHQKEFELENRRKEVARIDDLVKSLDRKKILENRMTVISSGDIPLSPAKDQRIRFAAVAGAAGAVLPAICVIGMSFVWRRYRYAQDAEVDAVAGDIPLLGVLPELRRSGANRDDMLAAAQSIHQIRVSLRSRTAGTTANTFLVTSAIAGEGKTSVTVSLGLSFAAARLRTLVIDADLIGRRLTEHFSARAAEGLHEAISGAGLRGRARRSDVHPNLHLLPTGQVTDEDACGLSAAAFRELLEDARSIYDIILIDSGPILGSVEASVLAGEVDGTILVVSQGQQQRLVNQAIRRLDNLGATIEGIIFNRAKRQDFHQSSMGSSIRSSTPLERGGDVLVGATSAGVPKAKN